MRASQLAGVIKMARGIMGGNYVLLLLLLLYDGDTLRLTLTWIDYLGPSIYSYTPFPFTMVHPYCEIASYICRGGRRQ